MNSENVTDSPSSYWFASTPRTNYPALEEDIHVDVAVIGGGIVGITTAYLLQEQGADVAVIEADRILRGTTGHSTAKITSQHGLIYAGLLKEKGEELARQYAKANENAIQMIAQTSRQNNIECAFSWRPAYVFTQSDKYVKQIEDEVNAAMSLGIKASYLTEIPLPFEVKAAMRFDEQAQFHPLQYLQALAEKMYKGGGHIFEQTRATNVENGESLAVVTANGNRVKASKIVIATHFPFFDGGGLYFSRIYQDRSYIVAVTIQESFPPGTFISAESPSRSLRSQPYGDDELILVAGEHHKSGQGVDTNTHYDKLLGFANQTFQVRQVLYRWSTQDCITVDGIPYVGNLTPRSPDIYVATGFGKWGITNGTASARILSDLIIKGDSPWAQVYNPSRFTAAAVKSFVLQNLDVAANFFSGKLARLPDDLKISEGEAAVVKADGQRIGVYRDEQGKIHAVDTTCTHLGCELNWNNAEKSWDCPCHGSRFSYEGAILHGPAINSLNQQGEEANKVEARILT